MAQQRRHDIFPERRLTTPPLTGRPVLLILRTTKTIRNGSQESKLNPRYLSYNKQEAQDLIDEVHNRSFLRDMTEDEYEACACP